MPRTYQPPLSPRPQAIQSARPRGRRGLLLLPLLGLIPLAAAVLASEWPLLSGGGGGPAGQPSAASTITVAAATATPAARPTLQAIAAPPVATSAPTPISAASGSLSVAAASPTASAAASGATTGAAAPAGASAPRVVPTPQPASNAGNEPFRAYRVQPGDTVKFVADVYGVSAASIIQASGLSDPDHLRVGQLLTIPAQPGYLYRVQPGETLDQIAARTGVSSDAIATVSRLTVASVHAGDVILIPDLTAARSK